MVAPKWIVCHPRDRWDRTQVAYNLIKKSVLPAGQFRPRIACSHREKCLSANRTEKAAREGARDKKQARKSCGGSQRADSRPRARSNRRIPPQKSNIVVIAILEQGRVEGDANDRSCLELRESPCSHKSDEKEEKCVLIVSNTVFWVWESSPRQSIPDGEDADLCFQEMALI